MKNNTLKPGFIYELEAERRMDQGVYFGNGEEEVLLPHKYSEDIELGSLHKVFVYKDSLQRLVCTRALPKAKVGEFVKLEVKQVSKNGYFMDWGLEKDLLLPFSESLWEYKEGDSVLVRIYIDDKTDRIVCSAKTKKFLEKANNYRLPEAKKCLAIIIDHHELGHQCIVDNQYQGLIYKEQVSKALNLGDECHAYVKKVREDGKVDLSLTPIGLDALAVAVEKIINYLDDNDGKCHLHDKSDAQDVFDVFGMSKKVFKKALGKLYRDKYIVLLKEGFRIKES